MWGQTNTETMKAKYKKIEFGFGKIDDAVKQLQKHKEKGELVYGVFNGKELYSDVDDLDSAYIKVLGKTKAQSDEDDRKWHEEYDAKKAAHKAAIPQLTKDWIEKGNAILAEQYRELWAKCVPIRLNDLYEGMELGACLEIVKELNDNCGLELAKGIIEKQGHSGMSFGLVRSMVASFCDRGADFAAYVK